MSMSLDFYATTARNLPKLRDAYLAGDLAAVNRLAEAHADLSLTIGLDDLDDLSTVAFKSARVKPLPILPKGTLAKVLFNPQESSGVHDVNPAWVKGFATQSFAVGDLREVFFAWQAALQKRYGKSYEVTADHALGLGALLHLTKFSAHQKLSVVFAWGV